MAVVQSAFLNKIRRLFLLNP